MARIRISTTVYSDTLAGARQLALGPDSVTLDAAPTALISAHRSAEIDSTYAAYDLNPIDEPDEWGNLAAFRASVGATRRSACRKTS